MDVSAVGGNNPIDPSQPPSKGAEATAAEVNDSIAALKDKMNKKLTSYSTEPATKANITAQIKSNQDAAVAVLQIKNQIAQLKANNAPASQIADLESQLQGLYQTLGMMNATTDNLMVAYFGALEAPAGAAPSPGSPILVVPLPDIRSHITAQEQVNLFLAPSLATVIFAIMEKVVHQKLQNIDTYRQFMTNYIGQTEQFALAAAQSTMLEGQLKAQATMTQAEGQLISAGLQMGLGIASIAATYVAVGGINKTFDEKVKAVTDKNTPEGKEKIDKINTDRYQAINNELQTSTGLKTLQLVEQTLPNMVSGGMTMASAQYTIEAASAEAAKMLFQQATQAAQSIYQDMGQAIQASSQDISAFLQAFQQISSAQTQQA